MAKVEIQFLSTDESAIRMGQRLREVIEQAEAAGVKLGATGRKSSGEVTQGMIGLKGALSGVTAEYLSVTKAVEFGMKILREDLELRRKAAEEMRASAKAIRPLSELARTPEDVERMRGEVNRTRLETGVSAEEASRLQFSLESLGIGSERKRFAALFGITDPEALVKAAGQARAVFGEQAGTPIQFTNAMLGGIPRGFRSADFAQAFIGMSAAAEAVGGTPTESLAVLSKLTEVTRSPDVAAKGLQAMLVKLTQDKLAPDAKGIMDAIEKFDKYTAGMSFGERSELIGRQGAVAYEALRSRQTEIRQRMADIDAARGQDRMGMMAGVAEGDAELRAARDRARAGVEAEISRERNLGIQNNRREAAVSRAEAGLYRDQGLFGKAARTVGGIGLWGAELLEAPPESIGPVTAGADRASRATAPDAFLEPFGYIMRGDLFYGRRDAGGRPVGNPALPNVRPPGTQPAASQPVTINNYSYGDHFHLGQQDLTRPGAGAIELDMG